MNYTIDIDTGGTFTDGFAIADGVAKTVKVPTTPHDLTVCFMECVKAVAQAFGQGVEAFLAATGTVRFSNTIGTNTLIERDGARLGLLVSRGMESLVHGESGCAGLVRPEMVVALDEAVDDAGQPAVQPERFAILSAAQQLIDRGARVLVVVFANSDLNPVHERLARQVIKQEYPRDYLGSVPVFLAADLSPRSGLLERLNSAVLNAYIHPKLTRLLYKAGEELRRGGFGNNLLIGHSNGAVARVAKTRAINTYNSGPAAGLLGARELARRLGLGAVITADMGGTSFDLGCVVDGQASQALRPEVEGFRCNLPMLAIHPLGAGGGSIAAVADGRLQVGPRSAGALPGPACFDFGGVEATVTDADLVLGLLDPEFFLGGRMRLNPERAHAALDTGVAAPLGVAIEEAARRIKQEVDRAMGRAVAALAAETGHPDDAVLLAYGGACGLHACDIAAAAGLRQVVMTPFAAVSSAYSSSLMDIGHLYYRRIGAPAAAEEALARLCQARDEMACEALRDMRGEGYQASELEQELEVIVHPADGGQERLVRLPADVLEGGGRLPEAVGDAALIETLVLVARVAIAHHVQPRVAATGESIDAALKGSRRLATGGAAEAVPVYDRARLKPSQAATGPALVESEQTTVYLPPRWCLEVDAECNLIMTRLGDD